MSAVDSTNIPYNRASLMYEGIDKYYTFAFVLDFKAKSNTNSISVATEDLTVTKVELLAETVKRCHLVMVLFRYFCRVFFV